MLSKTFGEITPGWLTEILTQQGSLVAGQVLHVEQTRDPNLITANATLLLIYSPDAKGACPGRLFFKQNPMPAEAKFYREIAPTLTTRRRRSVSTRSTMIQTATFCWPMLSGPILRCRRYCRRCLSTTR